MTHINRNNIGKFWPVARKGSKYVAVASHNAGEAMPLIVVIRDVLKLVKNKKELRKIISEKQVKINGKEIREINYPICLFDVLSLVGMKKNYVMVLNGKKYGFEEISDRDAGSRVYKIVGRKILSKGVVQLNLMQGKNVISGEKVGIGDSVVIDINGKIVGVVGLKKGSYGVIVEGKHAGKKGKIEDVIERGGKKLVKIGVEGGGDDGVGGDGDSGSKGGDGGNVNVWIKNVIAVR